eukprot:TRINITY_DN3248_c0_g3_i1.p1 TRINITY_DN3248_c0_g3~~TRINITY_DN3248_c0_g3_i1.p1  ORF type:complete len:1230 (+),score=398.64 TRINITY_DN3248_c0_g3_i1:42-3731(+)
MHNIEFIVNGREYRVNLFTISTEYRLIDFLREKLKLRGTKECSGDGNTGASTVMLSFYNNAIDQVEHLPIEATIYPLACCHHKVITTIEGIGSSKKNNMDIVQKTLAEENAFQCGYCVPGIAMSLFTLLYNKEDVSTTNYFDIEEAFQGHLCRCTGYASFYKAGKALIEKCQQTKEIEDMLKIDIPEKYMTPCEGIYSDKLFLPPTIEDAVQLIKANPDAKIVAGNVFNNFQRINHENIYEKAIYLNQIEDLKKISFDGEKIVLGSMSTIEQLRHLLFTIVDDSHKGGVAKQLSDFIGSRYSGPQIRSMSTIGGAIKSSNRYSDLPTILALFNTRIFTTDGEFGILDKEISGLVLRVEFSLPEERFYIEKASNRRTNARSIATVAILADVADNEIKSAKVAVNGPFSCQVFEGVDLSMFNFDEKNINISIAKSIVKRGFKLLASETHPIAPYMGPIEFPTNSHDYEQFADNKYIHQPIKTASKDIIAAGEASFTKDIIEPADCLQGAYVWSMRPHAKFTLDWSEAAKDPAFVGIATAEDSKRNVLSGIIFDTRIFADKVAEHIGEPLAMVVAEDRNEARRLARMVKVEYEDLEPILDLDDGNAKKSYYDDEKRVVLRGNPDEELNKAETVVEGIFEMDGQDHVYMETHTSLVIPGEPLWTVYSSSQNMAKCQADVAAAVGLTMNDVQASVMRVGGGFGGKQDRPCLYAAGAAVAANKVNRPVRIYLDRREDMRSSGGRHPYKAYYKAAVDANGKFVGMDVKILMDGGSVHDCTGPVLEKMTLQMENVYYWPHYRSEGIMIKTNKTTNTAYRGFGVPQGVILTEYIIEHLADYSKFSAHELRELNFAKPEDEMAVGCFVDKKHFTPDVCALPQMWKHIKETNEFDKRRQAVIDFNANNDTLKRGIALIPQKCAVDFEVDFMNQGGAMVHLYHDGTVMVSHSAVEMGQGVHTKMRAIAAETLDIPIELVHVVDTATDRVPNTQPTAASSGADVAGPAVIEACKTIKARMDALRLKHPELDWGGLCWQGYMERVNMSCLSHFCLPELGFSWHDLSGYVGFYYSFGACIAEVEIDIVTGMWRVIRADVVQDAGSTLNPLMDLHQVEGAFIQGMGLYTLEQARTDKDTGVVLADNLSKYTIPQMLDMPREFNVMLWKQQPNKLNVCGSKATAEGPLSNSVAVYFALKDAITSVRRENGKADYVSLSSPLTVGKIRAALGDELVEDIDPNKVIAF